MPLKLKAVGVKFVKARMWPDDYAYLQTTWKLIYYAKRITKGLCVADSRKTNKNTTRSSDAAAGRKVNFWSRPSPGTWAGRNIHPRKKPRRIMALGADS